MSSLVLAAEGDPALVVNPNMNVPNSMVEAGAALLVQHLNDKESINGTCQIIDNALDQLPRPCSMIRFSLSPISQGQGQVRSFQTTSSGTLSMGGLKSDKYELHVTSPGYRPLGSEPVIVQRGQTILITLTRADQKK